MTRLLRWFAILPAIYLAWHFSLLVGLALLAAAEGFCPQDEMVSGLCVAPWFMWVEGAIFTFGAGLAAALIVASAALLAPAHKAQMACAVFISGCLAATYLGWTADALKESVAAVLTGLITLLAVVRHGRRSQAQSPGA